MGRGLRYVIDLFDDKGVILGYQDFKGKYEVEIDFLSFYSLTHSIKYEWKKNMPIYMNMEATGAIRNTIIKLTNKTKVCRYIYFELLKALPINNINQEKWARAGIVIDNDKWVEMYRHCHHLTVNNTLRSFQYLTLQHRIVTNRLLQQLLYNITHSNLCHFCQAKTETIQHLLFECIIVQRFWKDISMYLLGYLDLNRYLNKKDVIIGVENTPHDITLNFVFLLGKRYIYVTRCLKRTLNLSAF